MTVDFIRARSSLAAAALCAAAACSGVGGAGGAAPGGATAAQSALGANPLPAAPSSSRRAASGKVLSTSDGGQIFGFDISANGNTGVLASAASSEISVQTFDETTGAITKTLGVRNGRAVRKGSDYVADGIFGGSIALIDFQRAGIPGQTPAKDNYRVMNPVGAKKFTGDWDPTIKLFNVVQNAENQDTQTSVVYGYQREGSDLPVMIVANFAKNHVSNVFELDSSQFSLQNLPQFAQDTANNLAVFATSKQFGRAGGPPPEIGTIDLSSGKVSEFGGVGCPGLEGCGYANGIAYDSATGIACTTTELDGGVEFYNIAQKSGQHKLMPNGGGQTFAGSYVANDPIHQLFLIAQTFSSTSGSGSSVQVYDEAGNFVESINGLDFTDAGFEVIPTRVALNPKKRIGWVPGPNANQLTQFTY